MRVLSSFSERRKIERLLGIDPPPPLRTALSYTGCACGSGRIRGLTPAPAGCRYRDMGKLKFYDDTADDCMCPLLCGTYVPAGRRIPLSLRWNSFPRHWFELSCSSLLAPHRTCERNGYRSPTYTASPRALLTRFSMHDRCDDSKEASRDELGSTRKLSPDRESSIRERRSPYRIAVGDGLFLQVRVNDLSAEYTYQFVRQKVTQLIFLRQVNLIERTVFWLCVVRRKFLYALQMCLVVAKGRVLNETPPYGLKVLDLMGF